MSLNRPKGDETIAGRANQSRTVISESEAGERRLKAFESSQTTFYH